MKTLLAFLIMTTAANAADGITNASIYTVDRYLCGLTVPQAEIDANLVKGMREQGLTFSEAVEKSVYISKILLVEVTPYREKWCVYRTKKD